MDAGEDKDESESITGMSMQEAIVASCLLGREADIAAYRNAAAGGNISDLTANNAISSIRSNYSKLIVQALGVTPTEKVPGPDATK